MAVSARAAGALRCTAALLVVALLAAPVAAQGGRGKGRHRGAEPAAREQSTDEYSLDGLQVIEVVERGEGPAALVFYERVAALAEQQGDALRAARAWNAVAIVTVRQGRFQKAIQAADRAIQQFKAAGPRAQSYLGAWASAHAQLASAYRGVRDLPRARASLEEGIVVVRSSTRMARESRTEGHLLTGLANVAFAQQDYAAALAAYGDAVRFFEAAESRLGGRGASDRTREKVRRWTAQAYAGIGRAEVALGHPDRAEAAFDQGVKAARGAGLRETELELLSGQGGLALSRQDWAKALGLYQQAVALATRVQRTRNLPALYLGQSRALAGLGRGEEAYAAARQAVTHVEEIRADLGDATLRTGFFDDRQGVYRQAVRLALQAQHPEEAFALAERSRSRTFLDLLGSQTPLSKGRTRALVDEETRLRARLVAAQEDDTDLAEERERPAPQVEALDRDYRAFLERVRKDSLEQASLMAVEPVTLAEIQGLLPEGATLLEYELDDGGAVVWVVERQGFAVVRLSDDRQALLGQVRRFRAALAGQAPLAEVQAQAQALHRRLIGPARPHIHGQRLIIVPHGPLHYLPFAALRSPEGRWLVEDFALGTLPSASVLRYLRDKGAGAPARSLVVGNPDLGPALALPWAEREARLVGQREPDATVLLRADATEARVKQLAETAGLLHFASHAELDESDPLASSVLLVPGAGEDGRLEVREVFGLDLHARLVVLSACETGLGRLSRGDELVGLQRAFLYAGTPAVVTTLWKVDDRASFELVRAFYDRLDGAGPVEALRQAQAEALRAFPHPFAWAGFVVTAP